VDRSVFADKFAGKIAAQKVKEYGSRWVRSGISRRGERNGRLVAEPTPPAIGPPGEAEHNDCLAVEEHPPFADTAAITIDFPPWRSRNETTSETQTEQRNVNHDSPAREQCCAIDHFLIRTTPPPETGPARYKSSVVHSRASYNGRRWVD
jgi:hypothetical protein